MTVLGVLFILAGLGQRSHDFTGGFVMFVIGILLCVAKEAG